MMATATVVACSQQGTAPVLWGALPRSNAGCQILNRSNCCPIEATPHTRSRKRHAAWKENGDSTATGSDDDDLSWMTYERGTAPPPASPSIHEEEHRAAVRPNYPLPTVKSDAPPRPISRRRQIRLAWAHLSSADVLLVPTPACSYDKRHDSRFRKSARVTGGYRASWGAGAGEYSSGSPTTDVRWQMAIYHIYLHTTHRPIDTHPGPSRTKRVLARARVMHYIHHT
jgi:hypothetical protein